MVLWPVRAAQKAGAGRVIVVDSPERALGPLLPDGVELAVQEIPNGTGGAVLAAMAALNGDGRAAGAGGAAAVVVLSGDVPLVDAEAISGLVAAHTAAGAAAYDATAPVLEDPTGYARRARRQRAVSVVETKRPGDASEAEAPDP
jgi:bifunctional UDP-N-acetylglucosamine pyrophosphorylase/glucosamine-1-phosphate N-acetyltransferase